MSERLESSSNSEESVFEGSNAISNPFNQERCSDVVRDLDLSKRALNILASRLKDKNCRGQGTKVTFYRTKKKERLPYYDLKEGFACCQNIEALFLSIGIPQCRSQYVATMY